MAYQPTIPGTSSVVQKIAYVTNLDLTTLATTTMTYMPGMSAANTVPLFRVVRRRSGIIGIAVISVALGTDPIDATSALAGVASGIYNFRPVDSNILLGTTGDYKTTVGTANVGAATADIEVWGIVTS